MKVKFDKKENFLKEVSLKEIPCALKIKDKDVEQEVLKFRFLTPKSIGGHWQFEKDIVPSLFRIRDKTEGEKRARYEELLRIIKFHRLFPPRKQMRGTRKFHMDFSRPQEGKEPTTWFKMARDAGIKDAMDLIMHVTKEEKSLPSSKELLAKAIYRERTLKIPFSRESYYRFREEFMRIWEAFDRLVIETAVPKMLRGEKDSLLNKLRKKNPHGYKKARKSDQESEKFILRNILKNDLEDQERIAKRYATILEKAGNLYQKYTNKDQKGKKSLADSAFSNKFNSLMNEHISQCKADTKREKVLRVEKGEISTQKKETYIDSLKQSIISKDVNIKWSELIKLIENLVYKSDAIRLIQREAEEVCLGVVNYGINEIYRKIRKNLTVPEKRAFILAHYRQYRILGEQSPVFPFGGRIPKLDPIIWDFFWETGETTKVLVYLVLIFKYSPSARVRKDLAEELGEKWRRYLLFYPAWEKIEREEDKERKYQQAWKLRQVWDDKKQKFRWKGKKSLETPQKKDKEGEVLTLGDTLSKDLSEEEKEKIEVQWLIEKFCTPREVQMLKLAMEDYNRQDIAKKMGISRQAVSKAIHKAIRKIVENK